MDKVWKFLGSIPEYVKLVLVAALVFLGTSFCTGREAKTELADYIRKYETFQAESKKTVKMLDSVRKVAARQDVVIATFMVEADSLRQANAKLLSKLPSRRAMDSLRTRIDSLKKATEDSVELARTVIPAQDTLIQQQDSTIVVYRLGIGQLTQENIALRGANGVLVIQNGTLRAALDSARTTIINIPPPPKDPDKFFFGLLKKPTRTQAVVIGFVGGVITTTVIVRAVP